MATMFKTYRDPIVHVRFGGRSFDVLLETLGMTSTSSDEQIKSALARQMEIPRSKLDECVLDRHSNGNLTLRPEAVSG